MNSVTPVFDYQEPPVSAKPATNTGAPVLKKTVAPPPPESRQAVSESDRQIAQTTLPGSTPKTENLTPEGIKSAVGEIVQNFDRDNAWSNITNDLQNKLSQQTKLDDEEALKDPANIAWSISAGAEIAQFATA
jgi:hypothetical protein